MTFEEITNKLKGIIDALENKDISLDEGIKLFDTGISLTQEALKILNEGQGTIKVLKQKLDDIVEQNFDENSK